jgi:putative inorganic carbon (HCO3(-)) transporter
VAPRIRARSATDDRFRKLLRIPTLCLLAAAPLALGAVHEPAFIPLLVVGSAVGILSWARGHWVRTRGGEMPIVPGERLLILLHALVLGQLLPLPPWLLHLVSPGSFHFYDEVSLLPLSDWRPISVNPADTARGFAFLAGMSLLYAAVFREFRDDRWRRRLAGTVVVTGLVMTVAALIQAASPEPTKIYGIWKPVWDWAVFGPYVNRNHFAGYLAMAIPLSLGLTAEALVDLATEWSRRPRGWVALGEPAGNAAVRRFAYATVLLVGLLASRSRGGLMGATLSLGALPMTTKGRSRVLVSVVLVAIILSGLYWIDLGPTRQAFESRGIRASRVDLWRDSLHVFPHFPLLGCGFDAFATAYPTYQTLPRYDWYGEVHNEYLQVLIEAGLAGAVLMGLLLWILLRAAVRAARESPLDGGILGALLACCFHNLVDFNWQIPANAATFAALAGLAVRRGVEVRLRALPPVDSQTGAA